MGCQVSSELINESTKKSDDDAYAELFEGLNMNADEKCKTIDCIKQMDALKLPYTHSLGILHCMKETQQWNIYYHFSEWPVKVSAMCIRNLTAEFDKSVRAWLAKLKGYNGFSSDSVVVKVFGFVFNKGVDADASFYNSYGKYPIVKDWEKNTEESPWMLEFDAKKVDFYSTDLDLSQIRVVGNKKNTSASFLPLSWENYQHPENISNFYTKFWLGTEYNATAQRHYLRLGGVVSNYTAGTISERFYILLHEMGHCFYLDDLYDSSLYVYENSCDSKLKSNDSLMFYSKKLEKMDFAMLRHTWNIQQKLRTMNTVPTSISQTIATQYFLEVEVCFNFLRLGEKRCSKKSIRIL